MRRMLCACLIRRSLPVASSSWAGSEKPARMHRARRLADPDSKEGAPLVVEAHSCLAHAWLGHHALAQEHASRLLGPEIYRGKRRQRCIGGEQLRPFPLCALRRDTFECVHGLVLEWLDVDPAQLSDVSDGAQHARDVLG